MKGFIARPFEIFKRERQINAEIQEGLAKSNQVSDTQANLICFFIIANIILLVMNLFIYFAVIVVLVTTPFYPLIGLLRLVPPLLFLPFLRLFQTRWIPKVRRVHMDIIGFDVDPIIERYSGTNKT